MKQKTPSPQREALRQAIEKKTARAERLKRLEAAADAARELTHETGTAIERAETDFAFAKQHEDHDLTARILGEEARSPLTPAQAAIALAEAKRVDSEAQKARAAITQRLQNEVSEARVYDRTDDAIRDVLIAESATLIEQFLKAKKAYLSVDATLQILSRRAPDHFEPIRYISPEDRRAAEADRRWVDAIAALEKNADARLPE